MRQRAGFVQSSTQLVDVELVAWKVKCASFSTGGFLGYINIKNAVCLVMSASLHRDNTPLSTSYVLYAYLACSLNVRVCPLIELVVLTQYPQLGFIRVNIDVGSLQPSVSGCGVERSPCMQYPPVLEDHTLSLL